MKFICRQSDLNAQISLASRAVSARPTHPVLGNILLKADGETLTLTGFDLSLGIQCQLIADVIQPGAITLPAKLLGDIIGRSPSTDLTFELGENNRVTITSESGKFQISGTEADEFPALPTIDGEPLQFPLASFTEGVIRTAPFASTDEAKQILRGVHITQNGDRLEFASTDGHRLGVLELDSAGTDFVATLPARALQELERMGHGLPEDSLISLAVDDAQAIFTVGDKQLICRKLDGAYPAYRQLIPVQFSRDWIVDRRGLISALERVGVLSDPKNQLVVFSSKQNSDKLAIAVEAQDLGNGKESISAEFGGLDEDYEIAFNIKYLLEGLKAMPSNDVKIKLNEPTQPVIFNPIGGCLMTYLVMPVALIR